MNNPYNKWVLLLLVGGGILYWLLAKPFSTESKDNKEAAAPYLEEWLENASEDEWELVSEGLHPDFLDKPARKLQIPMEKYRARMAEKLSKNELLSYEVDSKTMLEDGDVVVMPCPAGSTPLLAKVEVKNSFNDGTKQEDMKVCLALGEDEKWYIRSWSGGFSVSYSLEEIAAMQGGN